MIQLRTWLDVADNSGAKRCHAIKVVGRGNKSTAEIGDIVVMSVKKAIPASPRVSRAVFCSRRLIFSAITA